MDIDLANEFETSTLVDPRRKVRVKKIAIAIAKDPQAGLPSVMKDEAELEGLYRFFKNEYFDHSDILQGHYEQTTARCIATKADVVIAHDTTEFDFTGYAPREGLGRLRTSDTQGFFCHYALAIGDVVGRGPLGVINMTPFFRHAEPKSKAQRQTRALPGHNEAERWWKSVEAVAGRLGASDSAAIHVMDREADSFEIAHRLMHDGHRFVIRAAHLNRSVFDPQSGDLRPLRESLLQTEGMCEREVKLSRRPKRGGKIRQRIYPPRDARSATLAFCARTICVQKGEHLRGQKMAHQIALNVVHVVEKNPPADCEPVQWVLLTREPISTPEEVVKVVDAYRARWLIEEFFKAIKTGCAFEKRQLKSSHALLNALAIFSVVAWRMILLRYMSRRDDAPASAALRPSQLAVLSTYLKLRELAPLPENPTAKDALNAIAKMGGHIKNNGPPGWIVLGRGYQDLTMMELGWLLRDVG